MIISNTKRKIILFLSKFYYWFCKRDKNIWVFGEWFGNRCCDNCLYFANYVKETKPDIKIVWLSNEGVDLSRLSKDIEVQRIDSPKAINYLKHAGVVFFSHGMIDLTYKERHYYSGSLAVNLWHGSTPWKKIHFDTPMDLFHKILLYTLTKWHEGNLYIVSSEIVFKIFQSAFHCSNRDVIRAGCPKNTVLYSKDFIDRSRRELIKYCKKHNISVNDDVKIVTYLPTFREKGDEVFSFKGKTIKGINDILEKNNAILVQKMHYASQKVNGDDFSNKRIITLKDYYTQELLAASDILISDYSSCIFDYLILDRPIIHFIYDYDSFKNTARGLYFTKDEVISGDAVDNMNDLIETLNLSLEDSNYGKEIRAERRKQFLEYESPLSCKIIFENIMNRL